jgi:Cu/Ag efflux pump CusA
MVSSSSKAPDSQQNPRRLGENRHATVQLAGQLKPPPPLLQTQDRIIKSFPEVQSAYGKAGRASTATDPAPLEMSETVIHQPWISGAWVAIDKLTEMDAALQIPGVLNA